jgi:hypothetical protein
VPHDAAEENLSRLQDKGSASGKERHADATLLGKSDCPCLQLPHY